MNATDSITYESDYYGWIQQQVKLLKTGQLTELDLEHLIEEIEGLGASQRAALVNQIARLYLHLLKSQHQPQRRSRSWELSIQNARIEIEELLEDNPSFQPWLTAAVAKGYAKARKQAAAETRLAIDTFPIAPPFDFSQAMTIEIDGIG